MATLMSFETLAPIIFLMALREKVSPILYGNFVFKKSFYLAPVACSILPRQIVATSNRWNIF